MALFGKKKQDESDEPTDDPQEEIAFAPQPEKARTWFNHAKTMADSANYETSLIYYVNGLKLDPTAEEPLMEMLKVAIRHSQEGGKQVSGKKARSVAGDTPIDRMATDLLAWVSGIQNASAAIKAIASAHAADQSTFGARIAPTAFNIIRSGKKQSKSSYTALKDICKEVQAWDVALESGRIAMHLDPSDGSLDAEIKAMEAELAMAKGGFENAAGKEGGFRDFVKDMDKQRELEEEESLAGVGGGGDRVLERAREQFEAEPSVPDNVNRYGMLLRRSGTPESLKKSRDVYKHGYRETGEYRFHMAASDIRIQQYQEKIQRIKVKIKDDGHTDELAELLKKTTSDLLTFEAAEYTQRAQKYPTDRNIKFQLGEVAMRRNDIETAMGCFQKAKDEPRLRTRAGHSLGLCFAAEGWHSEAIAEFKDVLAKIDATEANREMQIRYDLMRSLQELAVRESSIEHAREALEICSGIARKDIMFQDIREQRRALDELVRSL